jgi:aminoglycoside phosphotransferase (APT) family kinase protein
VATLADGRELTIRVADDEDSARELASEAIALRALTAGAREMLPFQAPEYIGETRIGDGRALVTGLLPGFQIEASQVPAGRGAAWSIGEAIAATHALPASVVRGGGLTARDAAEAREEVRRLVERATATGRVPARLGSRWRQAVDDDDLWRFESTVTLGGVQADSFLFEDDAELGPQVVGLVGWHGLSLGDPAVDLAWLSAAKDAADDVHDAYGRSSAHAVDSALRVRARLRAELEFARWLVHGEAVRRTDIIDDAAALLESLAEGVHDDLRVSAGATADVDSALDAAGRLPQVPSVSVDTSMQTDAYRPEDLWQVEEDAADGPSDQDEPVATTADGAEQETQDLADLDERAEAAGITGVRGSSGDHGTAKGPSSTGRPLSESDEGLDSAEEAQRAARAALQRWTSSTSE